MKQILLIASAAVISLAVLAPGMTLSFFVVLNALPEPDSSPEQSLPGRATATPTDPVSLALLTPAASPDGTSPDGTSPFTFPTAAPPVQPTPVRACTAVFPLDNIEAVELGQTQLAQLEASFGRATAMSGRPTRFRFEDGGCRMLVTVGALEAQEIELQQYGTLGLLLDRYGPPAAVGESEGNLALIMTGYAVLLYPEQGVIAIFDQVPASLRRDTMISRLFFRPPFEVEQQITRLNLRPVEWQPPLR